MKSVEESYGENMLTLARGYSRKKVENAKVVRFLNVNYPDLSSEFAAIAAREGVCGERRVRIVDGAERSAGGRVSVKS